MAAAKNTLMKATVDKPGGTGTEDIYFMSNENLYSGAFATTVGIAKAAEAERINARTNLRYLISAGYLYRCFVIIKGTSTKPPTRRTVLVANNKFGGFRTWANAGTNTLPDTSTVIGGGLRLNRMVLE